MRTLRETLLCVILGGLLWRLCWFAHDIGLARVLQHTAR